MAASTTLKVSNSNFLVHRRITREEREMRCRLMWCRNLRKRKWQNQTRKMQTMMTMAMRKKREKVDTMKISKNSRLLRDKSMLVRWSTNLHPHRLISTLIKTYSMIKERLRKTEKTEKTNTKSRDSPQDATLRVKWSNQPYPWMIMIRRSAYPSKRKWKRSLRTISRLKTPMQIKTKRKKLIWKRFKEIYAN